jgi:hypothetical protein
MAWAGQRGGTCIGTGVRLEQVKQWGVFAVGVPDREARQGDADGGQQQGDVLGFAAAVGVGCGLRQGAYGQGALAQCVGLGADGGVGGEGGAAV